MTRAMMLLVSMLWLVSPALADPNCSDGTGDYEVCYAACAACVHDSNCNPAIQSTCSSGCSMSIDCSYVKSNPRVCTEYPSVWQVCCVTCKFAALNMPDKHIFNQTAMDFFMENRKRKQ
mmetsp:Transcript_11017/g.15850  ORF Transcript_11017/g.15850 Transcript_11017/m.15850 type:complete len:119 (-) Transcript_11017:152-508(-)